MMKNGTKYHVYRVKGLETSMRGNELACNVAENKILFKLLPISNTKHDTKHDGEG
jgi:hypothetical protein